MQIRNNYDKNVFNGDMGYLVRIDLDSEQAYAEFEGQIVEYEFTQLDQLLHAYAVSVHNPAAVNTPSWSCRSSPNIT